MSRTHTIAAAVLVVGSALALPAMAKDLCNAGPQDGWRPQAELEKKLAGDGWTVRKVKTGEGCYEVYAKDKDGKRREVYFDPKTFAVVRDES